MSIKTAPVPKDVQELLFKQSSIHQISENFTYVPPNCNLVAADGKRGLLYVGYKNKIAVLKLGIEGNIEWKIELELKDIISRLSLNCDFSYLAVILSAPAVQIYSAASLSKNVLDLLHEIRLSTSIGNIIVTDLRWNPAVPGMLSTVTSDFTIGSFQIKPDRKSGVGITALEKIEGLEPLCLAWSPKGKQIVVGSRNGNIVQLKPDLKPARTIPGPNPNLGSVKAILWVSNYQFCAAYQEPGEQKVNVMIIDAPKGETLASFTNYEDITYGGNPTRYYFDSIPEWGVIFAASSSSSEIAVLGSIDNGISWEQWQLVDSGRAELPLVRTDESFPVGLAVDRSSDRKLAWGPETTLPNPVPVLHILGTSGQLCSFHIVNLKDGCPSICVAPKEVVAAPQVSASIPAPRQSISSSEISFNLTTGATSTPRSKSDSPNEKPKNLMMTNFFAEATKPPPIVPKTDSNPPALPQIETKIPSFPQPPEKPTFSPPEIKTPKPRVEKVEETPQEKVSLPERKEFQKELPKESQEKPTIDENLCLRAYREEQSSFEKELKTRLEPLTWECGTNSERQQLIEKTALIDEFLRDLEDTTTSLSSDVAYLKALLLQSFAWLEETKSKKNCERKLTRKGDSKLVDLQRFFYYTQSQLVQASQVLDLEWSEKQSKDQKMKIPNMEFIYQSLVRHGQILAKEKTNLENLYRKWKLVRRSGSESVFANLNRSLSNLQISSSGNSAIDLRCREIARKAKSFSREKQMKLRDLLSESPPRIIRAAKPTLIQDRLEATLTNLASMSPGVSKPKVEKVKSPLASLTKIVSKIGTGNESMQKIVPTFAGKSLASQKPKIQEVSTKPSKEIPFAQKTEEIATPGIKIPASGSHVTPPVSSFNIESTITNSFSFASKPALPFSFPSKPEEKNLDLGGLNLSLPSGLSINLVPEKVSSPQVTSSLNFGKASVSTTNAFGTPGKNDGSIFGKAGNQGIGGSSLRTTGIIPAPSGISNSLPSSIPTVPSPLIVSTVSKPSPVSTSASTPNPVSIPSPVSAPLVPSVTTPPAYKDPISAATSAPEISLTLSPKPSSTVSPTTSIFSTPFGTSHSASTLNFGNATALSSTSITPVFGKEPTSTPGSIFGGSTISAAPAFGKSSTPFGGSPQNSSNIFGSSTSPTGSIFGGSTSTGSIFGGGTAAPDFGAKTPSADAAFGVKTPSADAAFGAKTPSADAAFGVKTPSADAAFGVKTPGDAFGMKTGSVFGIPSQNPVFGSSSLFGGGGAKPPEQNFSVFGGATAFGQAPAFGAKPAFGGSPDFGQKPAFGTGFGGTAAFGGSPASPAGFGSPPIMGASPPPISTSPMQKVFGGSPTFENLATQSGGLSFSSLAQGSPEQQQQQQKPPEFAANSSFSSWR